MWSRVAATAMLPGQATMKSFEADVYCYMDDPLSVFGFGAFEKKDIPNTRFVTQGCGGAWD